MGKETCCGRFPVGTCHPKTSKLAHKIAQKLVVAFVGQAETVRMGNLDIVVWTKGVSCNQLHIPGDILLIEGEDGNSSLF